MGFLAKFRPERIVAWLSRGAVPVDGQLWVERPQTNEKAAHAVIVQNQTQPAAQQRKANVADWGSRQTWANCCGATGLGVLTLWR